MNRGRNGFWLVVLLPLGLAGCPGGTMEMADMASSPPDVATPPDIAMPPPDIAMPPPVDMAMKPPVDMALMPADMTMVKVAKRPSKSSTIAIADNDGVLAVVNTEDGSVSFFNPANNMRISKVATGKEPSSVVIHPDGVTAFVANRGDATVVKIAAINTGTPVVSAPTLVGSEPSGIALSPTGAKLFVAEFAEGRIGVIDTTTMMRSDFVMTGLRNPRAVTVTNNGDMSDADEMVIVPEFYGDPVADKEARNDGRTGRVHLYGMDGMEKGPIMLAPFANTEASFEAIASPNQLYAAAVANGKVYIPSVSSAPNLPLASDKNVYPIVYVGDLATKMEVKMGAGTANLAQLVMAFPAGSRWFLGELVDMDFKPTTSIAYAVSRASSVVQRIDYSGQSVAIGAQQVKQIDVLGAGATACQEPNGIVIANTLEKAFVNCWVTRRLAILDLTSQAVQTVVESAPPPAMGSPEERQQRGRHFFFTGRGRWSGNGTGAAEPTENGSAWSSCGTCHPDGLTDNITWIFGAGPRQTTSMDGSFSHGNGAQKRRIFNWSAIIDEMHDFEANTRGTSGGKGAITTSMTCGTLASETRSAIAAAALGVPVVKELQDTQTNNCVKDWDEVDEYVKVIRPPRARRYGDAASVARGAALFAVKGGCAKCHGGAGWTVSNRFYTPSAANNGAMNGLAAQAFTQPVAYKAFASGNATQIAAQNAAADTFVMAGAIPPLQLTCALRNVNTFGVPGDATKTDALETRAAVMVNGMSVTRAQGRGGYNVPSLYGLATGAPYLHHGQARTLEDLFTDTKWKDHWLAGNPNLFADNMAMMDRADLINFILAIAAAQAEIPVPVGFSDGCLCRDGTQPPVGGCAP